MESISIGTCDYLSMQVPLWEKGWKVQILMFLLFYSKDW